MKQYTVLHTLLGPFEKDTIITEKELRDLYPYSPALTDAQNAEVVEANIDRLLQTGAMLISDEGINHEEAVLDDTLSHLTPKTLKLILKDYGYSGETPKTEEGMIALIKQLKANKVEAGKLASVPAIGEPVAVAPADPFQVVEPNGEEVEGGEAPSV